MDYQKGRDKMEAAEGKKRVKAVSTETFVFLAVLLIVFGGIGRVMGVGLMFKTMMATAHDLLLQTVFLIMALAVLYQHWA